MPARLRPHVGDYAMLPSSSSLFVNKDAVTNGIVKK